MWLTGVPSFILPSPLRVAQAALDNRVLIAENALVTATEVILGLITGTVLGAFTAVQFANSDRLHRLVMPLLIFTQAVPVFALAPILTLWFGYGIASKVVMAVLIIYFPVTSAFYDGLTQRACRTSWTWPRPWVAPSARSCGTDQDPACAAVLGNRFETGRSLRTDRGRHRRVGGRVQRAGAILMLTGQRPGQNRPDVRQPVHACGHDTAFAFRGEQSVKPLEATLSLPRNQISGKLTFMHFAALNTSGSLLPFAARCTNVRLEAKL